MKGLLLIVALVATAVLAAAAEKTVLAGARIDRVTGDFAVLTGGAVSLSKDDLNLAADPIVGYPPMLIATLNGNDNPVDEFGRNTAWQVRGNYYEQGAKDKVPNTVFHSAVTYGDLIFTYGGLIQDTLLPVQNSPIDTSFQYFDTNNFKWVDLTSEVPAGGPSLWGHCAVMVGSRMVLLGGRSGASTLNDAAWWIDLDNVTSGWFSYDNFDPAPQFYDATCFHTFDERDYMVVIGGRDLNEVYPNITWYNISDAFNDTITSTPRASDCNLRQPRFGADGDFFQNDALIASTSVFVVVGGFADQDYHPISAANDEHVLFYNYNDDVCATSYLPLPPRPAFPDPQPLHRYVFSDEEFYSKINLDNIPDNRVTADWEGDEDAFITGEDIGPVNNGIFEVDGLLNLDRAYGRHNRALLIPDINDWAFADMRDNVISFEMFFSTNDELNEYRNEYFPNPRDGAAPTTVHLMNYGYTYTLPAGSLGPFTLGLYMDEQKRLVSYITGDKELDVWSHEDIFNAIKRLEYEKPFAGQERLRGFKAGRSYAAAVRSEATIASSGDSDFHVACNWNLRDLTMNIILNGVVVAEGPMLANFKRSPFPIDKFAGIGRSLNRNPGKGPRSQAERPFGGNISEVRFYHGELDAQRCSWVINAGPDMGPRARGYHNVFTYENNIIFTGGYGVEPATDEEYYLRPYTDLWSISCPGTGTSVEFGGSSFTFNSNSVEDMAQWMAVDPWNEPALETEEIDRFIASQSWHFPMNRPFGTAIDLPAFRSSTFSIKGPRQNQDF